MVLEYLEPVFRVSVVDQATKKETLLFVSEKELEARKVFKSLFPGLHSLKDWREIQGDSKRYTEVKLMRYFTETGNEFPSWRGFVETRYLRLNSVGKGV